MWTSLEILVPAPSQERAVDFSRSAITVVVSDPPRSHRGPSSLWQSDFSRIGGRLYHLGDPVDIKVRKDRYYLYDAFDPEVAGPKEIKLRDRYQEDFEEIVRALCCSSRERRIFIGIDTWLGPQAKRNKRPVDLESFFKTSRLRPLRTNSFWTINCGECRPTKYNLLVVQ